MSGFPPRLAGGLIWFRCRAGCMGDTGLVCLWLELGTSYFLKTRLVGGYPRSINPKILNLEP